MGMTMTDVRRSGTRSKAAGDRVAWRICSGLFVLAGLLATARAVYDVDFGRQNARRFVREHPTEGRACMIYVDPAIHSYADWGFAPLLARADSEGYAYLESHPVLLSFVDNEMFGDCQPGRKGDTPFAMNLVDTDVILLNDDKLPDDRSVAAAVSHELVHVRYGDARDPLSHRSLLSQIVVRSEEADAHLHNMKTARLLGVPGMPNRLIELLVFVYPVSSVLALTLLGVMFCEGMRWRLPAA